MGSNDFLRLKTAAKAVFNIAIGYEYLLKPTVILNTNFRTNRYYFDNTIIKTTGLKSDYTSWDLYHFTAGSTIKTNRLKISIGLLFSTGTDGKREQEDNFNKPKESNFLKGESFITKATYSSFGFLLGYIFMLKK